MNNTAIKIENISKRYTIKHEENNEDNFRELITNGTKKFITRLNPLATTPKKHNTEEFWALNDINFEIKKGDKVGIIGRNGAGKSTLLKVLSRITEPTTGKIHINGRIASLLEVGTGFHPELTGRENIFLNGAILGMSRKEIKIKFDEIVDFSGVEKFLDTPVKRYSSGMYVRLAFAVAAHLEPDILIVDEVLAVGDAEFQKKCLGKMDDANKEGRTIIFVSHNMNVIQKLCDKGIYVESGKISYLGKIKDCIDKYYAKSQATQGNIDYSNATYIPGDDSAKLIEITTANSLGDIKSTMYLDEEIHISMKYKLLEDNMNTYPNLHIYNSESTCVFITSDNKQDPNLTMKLKKGVYISTCIIPANYLNEQTYYIGFALTTIKPTLHVHFFEQEVLQISVIRNHNKENQTYADTTIPGIVRPLLDWQCKKL